MHFSFGINWSAICVVQHKCAMIVMGEGYFDRCFFFLLFFVYKCAIIVMGEGYVDRSFFLFFFCKE